MKRLFVVLTSVVAIAIFGAVFADTPLKDPTPEDGKHFRHDVHEAPLKNIGVDVWAGDQCKMCHTIDAKGQPMAPVAQGHAPCMKSGCHADEFIAIGKTTRDSKNIDQQQQYRKAAQFCVGCHPTVPTPWANQKTLIQESWRNQREHHIAMERRSPGEGRPPAGMDHYDHIVNAKKKLKDGTFVPVKCRDCHAVGADFALVTHTPGHEQCMTCHTPGNAFPLTECGRCHVKGSRQDWVRDELTKRGIRDTDDLEGSRPKGKIVRACKSQGDAAVQKKYGATNKKMKCFKHETSGHRLSAKNEDIQCEQCHHMIANEKSWAPKTSYRSIIDLHSYKIIGTAGQEKLSTSGCGGKPDKNDAQHAACSGGTACHEHAKAVDLNCGLSERNCVLCHAERTNNEAF